MNGQMAAQSLRQERKFLGNILKDFRPEHGEFRPAPGMMTVQQQIRHIAHTVHWFREGAFGKGFSMDFAAAAAELEIPKTLAEALAELNETYERFITFVEPLDAEALSAPMPDNPIFGPAPRAIVIPACMDHSAHHRGALAVYLRLLGIVPTMIYTD